MKIVHVVEAFAGGIVTFVKSLVENMPDDSHIIVHGERKQVIPFCEVKKQFAYPNVKFLRWKSAQRSLRIKKDMTAAIELYSILKRLKHNDAIDIVHLHSSKGGFIGRVVCRLLGMHHMVVYTPNGAPFLGSNSHVSNFIYKHLERLADTFGGQVVCCSNSEQAAYRAAGIKALMINNGTQHEKTIRTVEKRKRNAVFKIVTSGRIVNQKNPALFNAIATYFEEFRQFEFLWVGDGTDRKTLKAKNIKITGWLQKEEINDLVENADLYLSTAQFEGLPFSVLEALALKKPVLLTNCVGNKDLVMDGLNGDVFSNESEAIHKILRFYNNSSMLGVMGEYSSNHCRTSFDQADTYRGYRKLYQKASFVYKESNVNLNQLAHGTR